MLTIFLSSFRGCTPKSKDVTLVDLSGAPAPASEPEPAAAPEPEIRSAEQKPKPKPELKPEKKLLPKPVVTNTPPKKAETNSPPKKPESKKPAVTNAAPKKAETNAPAKTKTEAEKLAAIRQDNRVPNPNAKANTLTRPSIDYSGLRNALNSSATGSGSGPSSGSSSGTGSGSAGGMYSPFAGYYDSIKQQMYAVWQQPAGVGLRAIAAVRVERDGTVSLKSITLRSGNGAFDQSVQNALNATVRLPIPPADLPDRTISIEFLLSD